MAFFRDSSLSEGEEKVKNMWKTVDQDNSDLIVKAKTVHTAEAEMYLLQADGNLATF